MQTQKKAKKKKKINCISKIKTYQPLSPKKRRRRNHGKILEKKKPEKALKCEKLLGFWKLWNVENEVKKKDRENQTFFKTSGASNPIRGAAGEINYAMAIPETE